MSEAVRYRDVPGMIGVRVSNIGVVQTRWVKCRQQGSCMLLGQVWRDCKTHPVHDGRLGVNLWQPHATRRGRNKFHLVHRLVMLAFVGPKPPGLQTCHNNGDPTDNRLENLRYDTPQGNSDDTARHGRRVMGSRHGIAKLDEQRVAEILRLLKEGELTLTQIGRRFGVSHVTISFIRNGKSWAHVPRP